MKYTFEVKRHSISTTQRYATVCINDIEVITFSDSVQLINGEWEGTGTDKQFIMGLFFHPNEEYYKNMEKLRSILESIDKM